MEKLTEFLAQCGYVHLEKPLNVKNVVLAQKELTRQGLPMLPQLFLDFLRQYNGVSAQDSKILGVPPLENANLDIIEFNRDFNQSADMVILGYDDFGFLVYNAAAKTYQLVDKDSAMVLEEFADNELEYAVMSVLHVSYE